jgi:hypothetical protein
MQKIALRAFTRKIKKNKGFHYKTKKKFKFARVLTFDTETSADKYLNLKFGYFKVTQNDIYDYGGLFYDKRNISKKEINTLKKFATENTIRLFTLDEFIEIFYWEVYENDTLVVGFNLNFDLSRIIQNYGYAQKSGKGGFTFKLSSNTWYPNLRIKQLGPRSFNIGFTKVKGQKSHPGSFIDVQNLACILLDEKSLSLEDACKTFNTEIKKKSFGKHGVITSRYIQYNIMDVMATFQIYQKVREEFKRYQLNLPITKVFSSASLGKQCFRQCGITSFFEKNPNFPSKICGYAISAYIGGRTECKVRKTATKVTVLDFFSMYPTVNLLLDSWKFIIARTIETEEVTKEIQDFIDGFNLEQSLDKESWKKVNVLVQISPKEDILPERSKHEQRDTYNIGINKITYKGNLYYFLPDILASKLLNGKSPKIKKAIRFIPKGKQRGLIKTSICGVKINPNKDNLFCKLVEERQAIKNQMQVVDKDSKQYNFLNAQQKALKIINNTISYGISVEFHPKDEKEDIAVYSNRKFLTSGIYEDPGPFFHPIVGPNITAGARLLLAIAEKYVADKGETHYYMDTDSIFVPPHLAKEVSHLFDSLNPYGFNKAILEIEDGMEDIWFYGICSKRYVLYHIKKSKFIIPESKKLFYKLHGLGHISNPFKRKIESKDSWHKRIWMDILRLHYKKISLNYIRERYRPYAVITKLSTTTKHVQKQFTKLNENKPLSKQIKPFNFILVGYGTIKGNKRIIKPLAPFSQNPQEAINKKFIDYYSGEIYRGMKYWKPLSDVIEGYINHPEAKFDGEVGVLKRRHIQPLTEEYIGKEANKLESQYYGDEDINVYNDIKKAKKEIISGERKINRQTRYYHKKNPTAKILKKTLRKL